MSICWKKVEYFDSKEFDDPNYPGSGKNINDILLFQIDKLRRYIDYPIIVTSAIDVDGSHGHAPDSYHLLSNGAKAIDFFIKCDLSPRFQARLVDDLRFTGMGVYYDWKYKYKLLPIGFHVDLRPVEKYQRWTRRNGEYSYWLGQ